MRTIFFRCIILCLAVLVTGCGKNDNAPSESITVFCGSANKPAMEEIGRLFEKEHNIQVNMLFGGSGTLLSQIELSKKGEIYIPGSPDYIVIGYRKKLLIRDSDRVVAYLVPAIITPAGNPAGIRTLEDLARPGVRVGIGNPETVCLGLYSIELLVNNNLLDKVMKNVVTFGESCSKTANLAAMKKVDTILGWRVFHYWNSERMDFIPVEPAKIMRLSDIPIAIPFCTKDMELSRKFISFTLSSRGRAIYEKYGYITRVDEAKKFAPGASIGGEYKLPPEYFNFIRQRWQK